MDINIGSIWTMLVGTAVAIVYMFNTFVTASEFESYVVEDMYENYYVLVDKRQDALTKGSADAVALLERRMIRLKVKICSIEPEWEECKKK